MEEVFKKCMEKNYHHKTIEERLTNFQGIRKQTRNTLLLQRRNIDLDNMSPLATPVPAVSRTEKVQKKAPTLGKTNKRLEMLLKWKEEKEKIKKEAKKKAKPIFKVCHVRDEVGPSNLDKANKEIKGKPIRQVNSTVKSWAPSNYKFQPPKNIKPINVHISQSKPTAGTSKASVAPFKPSTSSFTSVPLTYRLNNKKIVQNQINPVTRVTRAQSSKSDENRKTISSSQQKSSLNNESDESCKSSQQRKNSLKNPARKVTRKGNIRKDEDVTNTEKDVNDRVTELKLDSIFQNTAPTRKHVGWVTVADSDDVISDNTTSTKSSAKKKYANTPIKRKITIIPVSDSDEDSFKTPPLKNRQKKNNTPKHVNSSPNSRKNNSREKDPNPKQHGTTVHFDEEKTLKTPSKSASRKNMHSVELSSQKKYQTTKEVIDNKQMSFRTPRKSNSRKIMHVGKATSHTREQTPKEDKVTIHSDEDIYLRTPREYASRRNRHSRLKTPENLRKTLADHEEEIPVDEDRTRADEIPHDIDEDNTPAYISPFVTICRGKDSARKEFKTRLSSGGAYSTPDVKNKNFSSGTSPKMGAEYFGKLLDRETARIENICHQWEKYKVENELSEGAQTLIFVPICQSRLLISKKFQQFRGLIEKCRNSEYEDERPITCKDLHGFWDMIYMQVGDLEKRFDYLEKVKKNNWEEVMPEKKQVMAERKQVMKKRPRGRPKKPDAPSRFREFIRAARNKKGQLDGDVGEALQEIVQPAVQITPAKERFSPVTPSSTRRSLRVSLLCGKVLKRPSTSPCLTMMRLSQAIKSGDGVTPSKSILKSESCRSEKKMNKSVLFKDDFEVAEMNKENVAGSHDLICFTPVTPSRRSARLNKVV